MLAIFTLIPSQRITPQTPGLKLRELHDLLTEHHGVGIKLVLSDDGQHGKHSGLVSRCGLAGHGANL
jgi:hypothetical protein